MPDPSTDDPFQKYVLIPKGLEARARGSALTSALPRLVCVWAVAATILGRSFTALVGDPRDAQLFAYFGLQWAHGRIPYLDMWDNKPPGIFAVDALVFSIFPKSFTALAVVEGVFILGCIVTVFFLMKQWGASSLVASLAAGATAISSNLDEFNQRGNRTEIYLLWPAVLSMYFFTRTGKRFESRWVFLAGFFSGVASLFKAVGWAPLLAQFAFLLFLWVSRQIKFSRAVRFVLVSSTGMLVAWVPFSIYFWRVHAFGEMLNASLLYNLRYGRASQGRLFSEPFLIADRLHPVGILIVCALAGLVWLTVRYVTMQSAERSALDRFRFLWILVILWVLADLCGAIAGGRNTAPYFLCMTPSLSVAAGLAFWFVEENMPPGELGTTIRNFVFVLVLGSLAFSQAPDLFYIINVVRHRQMQVQVQTVTVRSQSGSTPNVETYAAGIEGYASPIEIFGTHVQSVADYLNGVRSPGDTLFTWNYLPLVYFETGMQAPTRFLDAHYLYDFKHSYDTYGEELLQELRKAPPTFIVDGTNRLSPLRWDRTAQDRIYQRFRDFVREGYELRYIVRNDQLGGAGFGDIKVYARVKH
jgi:Dolichyl-phosphate-mannose-protein mannosyltransferase